MSETDWAPSESQSPEGHSAPTPGQWPKGNYEGRFVSGRFVSSSAKGTPGMELTFDAGPLGGQKRVVVNCWLSGGAAEISADQLSAVGWNEDLEHPEFDAPEVVQLFCSENVHKGKTKEQWSISRFAIKPPPASTDPALLKFQALYRAKRAESGGQNGTAPKASPKPSVVKAPARPSKKSEVSEPAATNQDEAWAVWVAHKCEDADAFWKAVDAEAPGMEPEEITPGQWQKVAAAAPPF